MLNPIVRDGVFTLFCTLIDYFHQNVDNSVSDLFQLAGVEKTKNK